MVVSGLSRSINNQENLEESNDVVADNTAPIVDPDNHKIVTTFAERQLFDYVSLILGDVDIEYKDNESYFSILYRGKSTRWTIRYFDNKQRLSITVPVELTDDYIAEIERSGLEMSGNSIIIDCPENILRLSGLIQDCFAYCSNDENFRRQTS